MKQEKTSHYYAVFEPAEEGGFNISFPSFPGCVTFGRTFEEAEEKSAEVLELWLEELREQKRKIPHGTNHPFVHEIPIKTSYKKRTRAYASS